MTGNGNTIAYRVGELEREVEKLATIVQDVAVLRQRVDDAKAQLVDLTNSINSRFDKIDQKVDDGFDKIQRGLWVGAGLLLTSAITIAGILVTASHGV